MGTVGYHFFVKKTSPTITLLSPLLPFVAVLTICTPILLIFPLSGGLVTPMKQLSWVQLSIAMAVILIECGFLFMCHQGDLSVGNVVTGVIIKPA